jgi:hypothetical protein
VCALLGKKHGETDRVLQLTQANYRAMREKEEEFAKLDVGVYTGGDSSSTGS